VGNSLKGVEGRGLKIVIVSNTAEIGEIGLELEMSEEMKGGTRDHASHGRARVGMGTVAADGGS
jgi:hypothetical protein